MTLTPRWLPSLKGFWIPSHTRTEMWPPPSGGALSEQIDRDPPPHQQQGGSSCCTATTNTGQVTYMCYRNTVHVYFLYQNMFFYFRLQQNIILLNFYISDTDISNTMVMSKWFVSRNNFLKKVFYPRYLKVFKQWVPSSLREQSLTVHVLTFWNQTTYSKCQ